MEQVEQKLEGMVDAWLQELLTKHKMLSAEFLEANYDQIFSHYQKLLNSENYVTRRQALKVFLKLTLLADCEIKVNSNCILFISSF